ncbi:MAG TPA: HEAT repeat domain-containing protein, partial [Terriglobales bacterium]|nr:HEAT repeat domain-containing protein [Terriglobales bacterium]
QWLEDLDSPSAVTNVQTITAFRRMGAKAAVRLAPMLEASDSAFRVRAVELARKQTFVEVRFTPASVRWQRAEKGFEIMGEHAVAAAPGLVSLLVRRGAQPPDYLGDSADRAAGALARLGNRVIPYLRPALYSEHARVRQAGVDVLVMTVMTADSPSGTVAELFKLLDDSNPKARRAGAYALGKLGQQPALVIPRLERTLGDVSPSVRRQAAFALGRFASRASKSMAALRQACSDVAPEVRHAAETALTQIGGEAASSKDAGTSDLSDEK